MIRRVTTTENFGDYSSIASALFTFRVQAHFYHLNTKSFARHKALNELYDDLDDYIDSVSELLLGYQAPKRLDKLSVNVTYDTNEDQFPEKIVQFARKLEDFAAKNGLIELQNLAAEIEGSGAKAKYLFTLS